MEELLKKVGDLRTSLQSLISEAESLIDDEDHEGVSCLRQADDSLEEAEGLFVPDDE